MDALLEFDETHELLADGLDRYLKSNDRWPANRNPSETSRIWRDLANMGIVGLSISEDDGGSGASPLHLGAAMEAFGRSGASPSPLPATIICSRIVANCGDPVQHRALSSVAQGAVRLAFAHSEPGTFDPNPIMTEAKPHRGGFILTGQKRHVIGGSQAHKLIISARLTGEASEGRTSLFLVDADHPGIRRTDRDMIDGSIASEIDVTNMTIPAESLMNGDGGAAAEAIELALGWGIMSVCWEAVGIMARLLNDTIAYSRIRKQFGASIGTFQALQHRMVDMMIHVEQSRDAAILAAAHVESCNPKTRRLALSSAKFQIGQSATFVREQAVQIHGAIGMTEEIDVSRLFKRLMVIENIFGGIDDHLEALVATGNG